MTELADFVKQLSNINNSLQILEKESVNLYKDFEGNSFDNQNATAAEIENTILMLTHEVSTNISFGIRDLKQLIDYFTFRKKYAVFNNFQLSQMIDHQLSISEKLKLPKTQFSITEIQKDWNNTFNNIGYSKFKTKLSLK